MRQDLAGRDPTKYLIKILAEHGTVCDVREKLCCVALDLDTEVKAAIENSDKEKTDELPDRSIITVGSKCFRCPEVRLPSFVARRPAVFTAPRSKPS